MSILQLKPADGPCQLNRGHRARAKGLVNCTVDLLACWSPGSRTLRGGRVSELGLQPKLLHCNQTAPYPEPCKPKSADTGQLQVSNCSIDIPYVSSVTFSLACKGALVVLRMHIVHMVCQLKTTLTERRPLCIEICNTK